MQRRERLEVRLEVFSTQPDGMADVVRMMLEVVVVAEVLAEDEGPSLPHQGDRLLHACVGVVYVVEDVDHHDEVEALGRKCAFLDGVIVDLDQPWLVRLREPPTVEPRYDRTSGSLQTTRFAVLPSRIRRVFV